VSCGCGTSDVSFISSKIADTADAKLFSWTMLVSIRFNDTVQHSCAGTILTNRYILTAAHCVQNQSIWKIKVIPERYLVGISSKNYQIDRIHQHPHFKSRGKNFENDIALLHLNEPMKIEKSWLSSLTCVPKIKSSVDMSQYPSHQIRLAVIGWGITRQNQSYIADDIQQAKISVIDNKNTICSKFNIDPNKQFCAGFEEDGAGRFLLNRFMHQYVLKLLQHLIFCFFW
jgi:secreted trypsin-like serine protease